MSWPNYKNPLPIPNNNCHLKVCIIGGGVSGLIALKTLREYGFKNVTLFEQHEAIGGIWYYNENPNFVNAMYSSLHTNFPMTFMKFPDYSYNIDSSQHPPHYNVYKYINNYVDHFKIRQFIKLNHKIINVTPVESTKNDINTKWNVTYIQTKNKVVEASTTRKITKEFDIVIVCNGHFRHQRFPQYIDKNLNNINVKYIHSQSYRGPNIQKSLFKNKNVLLIGSGNTAADIANDLYKSKLANKIYHSCSTYQFQRKFFSLKKDIYIDDLSHEYYKILAQISNVNDFNNFINDNNIDLIIFATGYDYNFEFFNFNKNKELNLVYKHMFSGYYPYSLFFISLPLNGLTFVLSHFQSLWLAKILCDMKIGKITRNNKNNINNINENEVIVSSKYLNVSKNEIISKSSKNIFNDHLFSLVGGELFGYIDYVCKKGQIDSPVRNIVPMFRQWFLKRVPYLIVTSVFISEPAVTAAKAMKIDFSMVKSFKIQSKL